MTNTIDRDTHQIRFERQLDATPQEAFDAWTQPDEVTAWWDPTGTPLAACSIDLRPQGAFRFVTVGHAPPFEGQYLAIQRPNRLEFQAMGALGIVTFAPRGQGTLMSVSIRSPSAEHFEMFLKLGVDQGTAITLDNLARHVRARAGRPADSKSQVA